MSLGEADGYRGISSEQERFGGEVCGAVVGCGEGMGRWMQPSPGENRIMSPI